MSLSVRCRVSSLVLCLLVAPSTTGATERHVSPEGDDTAAGTPDAPLATLQACALLAVPGDRCIAHSGVYRETVRPPAGTAEAPVVFEVAEGERALVTGLEPATGWADQGDGTWALAPGADVTQLFVHKSLGVEARWPDAPPDWLRAPLASMDGVTDEGGGQLVVADARLPDTDWTGALLWYLHDHRWVSYTAPVLGSGPGWVRIDASGAPYPPAAESPYVLHGHAAALSADGEWFQDAAGTVHLVSQSHPDDREVEVRVRRYGFDVSGDHVIIDGFDLFAASVQLGGDDSTLRDSRVLYPAPLEPVTTWGRIEGVVVQGAGNTVEGCEVRGAWGDGISLGTSAHDNTVRDNLIVDTNWSASRSAAIGGDRSPGNTYTQNTILETGRAGILHRWETHGTTIAANEVAWFGFLTYDLGAIYTYGRPGDGARTTITGNVVHDSASGHLGDGIYLDNHSDDITVAGNVVWSVDTGVRLNAPSDGVVVANNTLWDVRLATASYAVEGGLTDIDVANNLANEGSWWGASSAPNLTVDAACFTDPSAGDFTLTAGCPAIDAGVERSGITDGYSGAAPDLGACEGGCPAAGITWTPEARHWYPVQTLVPDAVVTVAPDGSVTADVLSLGAGSTPGDDRALVRFELPDLGGGRFVRAVLELPLASTERYGALAVAQVSAGPWDASTATYGHADPGANLYLGEVAATGHPPGYETPVAGVSYDLDVTDTVAAWLDGSAPVSGFALTGVEGFSATRRVVSATGTVGPRLHLEVEPPPAVEEPGDTGDPDDTGTPGPDDSGTPVEPTDPGSDGTDTAAGDASTEPGSAPDKSGCACSARPSTLGGLGSLGALIGALSVGVAGARRRTT